MLSDRIFSDTPPRFFAVLTSRHGRLYIDVLDHIEELQRGRPDGSLSRQELLGAIESILLDQKASPEDEDGNTLDAPQILRYLISCGWIEKPQRTDYQSMFYLDSRSELLLEALRKIAYPEKVSFTDKLHIACTRLQDTTAFKNHPLADLEASLDNLRQGLQELRALQQGVARLTQRQLKADTLKENLAVLYDEFSENISQRCYKQLVALDLPIRLPLVREALRRIGGDAKVIAKMEAELKVRRPELTDDQVVAHVKNSLDECTFLLRSVEPQVEAVDRRAADFARRSFARFRYLQEVSGGRREELKALFEAINSENEGAKLSDLPKGLELPDLKVPFVGLLGGLDSLYMPRNVRITTERRPVMDELEYDDWDDALEEMSDNINTSLTVNRANRFYDTLDVPSKGLKSLELAPGDEAWLLELAGLLLHTDTSEAHYSVSSPREDFEEPKTAALGDFAIDEFTIQPVTD